MGGWGWAYECPVVAEVGIRVRAHVEPLAQLVGGIRTEGERAPSPCEGEEAASRREVRAVLLSWVCRGALSLPATRGSGGDGGGWPAGAGGTQRSYKSRRILVRYSCWATACGLPSAITVPAPRKQQYTQAYLWIPLRLALGASLGQVGAKFEPDSGPRAP